VKTGLVLLSLSLSGVYICRLIVLFMLDRNDPSAAKWCKVSGKFDCDRVLTSPAATLIKGVTWADLGLMYFLWQTLMLILAAIAGLMAGVLLLLIAFSALACLAGVFSMYYQGKVVGSWCKLCLAVIAIVWVQTAVLASSVVPVATDAKLIAVGLLFIVCLCLASLWIRVKPLAEKARSVESMRRQMRTWKKNFRLFVTLLRSQPAIGHEAWENEMVLGNPDAPLQIIAVIGLYCQMCKIEYAQLSGLVQRHAMDVKVIIRFNNSRRQATESIPYILESYHKAAGAEQQGAVLGDWFAIQDLDKFKERSGIASLSKDHSVLMGRYRPWLQENRIFRTPSFFIDGYPLPEPFRLADLDKWIDKLPAALGEKANKQKINV